MPRCFLESDFISGWVQLDHVFNSYLRLASSQSVGSVLEQSGGRITRDPSHCVYSNNYWSSTENNTTNAWNFNFNNGYINNNNNNNKTNAYYVRCVRSWICTSLNFF
ncbi:MAG: DUF1566 domain-containing protein [Pseudobdellovibrio sp.]